MYVEEEIVMSESKLFKYVAIGALVGATISMFDRKTREHTIETTKKIKDTVAHYAKNQDELQEFMSEKLEAVQNIYENVQDTVVGIVDKFEDVKEIPSAVQGVVNETKTAFSKNETTDGN